MRLRFWGVRGSTPTPQKENLGYGGNTSCIEVRTDGNQILIFDGGTGIRLLGKRLIEESKGAAIKAHIFFSHFHLDHIQGVPFFRPLYDGNNHFTFYFAGLSRTNQVRDALERMMANPYFPVDISKVPCSRDYIDLVEGTFAAADVQILALSLNHPQGSVGYRIMQNGKSIAYCTDVEHGVDWSDDNLKKLAEDVDILVVDSQYTPDELIEHTGWGHSSWKQAIDLGVAARAKKVVLFHHDPYHEDTDVDVILSLARQHHPNVIAAREGLEVTL